MGLSWTTVVTSPLVLTRLPSDTAARPVTPETGATTVDQDRLSSAWRTEAWAACTAARAAALSEVAVSYSR
jgi:hypothetical protein